MLLLFFTDSVVLRLTLMIPLLGLIIGGAIRAVRNNFAGIPGRLAGSLMFLLFYLNWLVREGTITGILACTLISYGVIVGLWSWSWKTEKEEHIKRNPSELIQPQPSHHVEEKTSPPVVTLSDEDRRFLIDGIRREIIHQEMLDD